MTHDVAIIGTVGLPARYGGFETFVQNLVVGDETADFTFTVYCSRPAYAEHPDRYNERTRLVWIDEQANGARSILYDLRGLLNATRSAHDRVLVLGVSAGLFLPFLKPFLPRLLVHIDGIEWRRDKWHWAAKKFLWLSDMAARAAADTIIVDNAGLLPFLSSRHRAKSELLFYGGDHALGDGAPVDSPELVDGRPYGFFVCRIEPENNIEMMLLGARAAFTDAGGDMLLIGVGNWNGSAYGRRLRETYGADPHFLLLDPIFDVEVLRAYRAHASFFCHGHSVGGTNPSLVEMMMFDRPILAYDCVFNRETTEGRAHFFTSSDEFAGLVRRASSSGLGDYGIGDVARRRYRWSDIRRAFTRIVGRRE